jgi:two-component system, LytTR family, sensor kinase
MRFENAFQYTIDIPDAFLQKQIPILALQTLVENIFKHNYFSTKNPLHFSITCNTEKLVVANNKVSIKLGEKTQTGLKNLNNRYLLIAQKGIDIADTETDFTVRIPVLA